MMDAEAELLRLTKENDQFRKIIETQQRTIRRLVEYFILEQPAPLPTDRPFSFER